MNGTIEICICAAVVRVGLADSYGDHRFAVDSPTNWWNVPELVAKPFIRHTFFSSILAISAVSVANVEWSIYDCNLISTSATLHLKLKVIGDKILEVPVSLSDYLGIWCPVSCLLYINHLQVRRVCREYSDSWLPCYVSPIMLIAHNVHVFLFH